MMNRQQTAIDTTWMKM